MNPQRGQILTLTAKHAVAARTIAGVLPMFGLREAEALAALAVAMGMVAEACGWDAADLEQSLPGLTKLALRIHAETAKIRAEAGLAAMPPHGSA